MFNVIPGYKTAVCRFYLKVIGSLLKPYNTDPCKLLLIFAFIFISNSNVLIQIYHLPAPDRSRVTLEDKTDNYFLLINYCFFS